MTTYAWPSGDAYRPATMEWGQLHNQRASTSSLSGYTQTTSVPGMRWQVVLTFPAQAPAVRAQLEGFLTKLAGMEHRVQLWDMGHGRRTGEPLGSINRSGVTLSATAAQFATSLALTGCGANTTLKAGDKLSVGGQLLTNTDDTTFSAGGTGTITVRPMLRAAASSGAAVTLIKPTALFVLAEPTLSMPRAAAQGSPLTVQFVEVFA